VPLISKKCIRWIGQLLELTHAWALHGDGKHKLQIGGWPLITWGTHCLKWDLKSKCYRHSYRPLIYLLSKNVETKSAGRLAMVALQLAPVHFFGKRLQSAVNISDCSVPGSWLECNTSTSTTQSRRSRSAGHRTRVTGHTCTSIMGKVERMHMQSSACKRIDSRMHTQ
jgi:hypothetical protein